MNNLEVAATLVDIYMSCLKFRVVIVWGRVLEMELV